MSGARIFAVDYDHARKPLTTYISSEDAGDKSYMRIDCDAPRDQKSWIDSLFDVFLPAGYPHSVTEDYTPKDSIQAFVSSIAGLLSSRAVLKGIGVGEAEASPTSALLMSVFQETLSRLTTISFAHRFGNALEPECKFYRLAADIFNDVAMVMDLLSPAFPKVQRAFVFATSSALRGLCGVAAGSSKASLSAHFARRGNLGELNAKDSSQETVISLLGLMAGSTVISRITSPVATWTTLLALLFIHLLANWKAVRSVNLRTLNRQRANMVFSNIIEHGNTLTPRQVSCQERIFEQDGMMRWLDGDALGYCRMGVRLHDILRAMSGAARPTTRSMRVQNKHFSALLDIFQEVGYILWFDRNTSTVMVTLKRGSNSEDGLLSWIHGLLVAKRCRQYPSQKLVLDNVFKLIRYSRHEAVDLLQEFKDPLRNAGWDLETAALETKGAGIRVSLDLGKGS